MAERIYQSFPRYRPTFLEAMQATDDAVAFTHGINEPDGYWRAHLKLFKRGTERPAILAAPFDPSTMGTQVVPLTMYAPDGRTMTVWGLIRLGPGVWAFSQSLNFVGFYHGYVVMRDVPDPAPWEARAVAGSDAHV